MPSHFRFKMKGKKEKSRELFRVTTAMDTMRRDNCDDEENCWTMAHVDVLHQNWNEHTKSSRDDALMTIDELWVHSLVVNANMKSDHLRNEMTVFEAVVNKFTSCSDAY